MKNRIIIIRGGDYEIRCGLCGIAISEVFNKPGSVIP